MPVRPSPLVAALASSSHDPNCRNEVAGDTAPAADIAADVSGADDVAYPGAIRRDEAEVKRGDLIEALDERFGPNDVNTAARTKEEAMEICNRLWPPERIP